MRETGFILYTTFRSSSNDDPIAPLVRSQETLSLEESSGIKINDVIALDKISSDNDRLNGLKGIVEEFSPQNRIIVSVYNRGKYSIPLENVFTLPELPNIEKIVLEHMSRMTTENMDAQKELLLKKLNSDHTRSTYTETELLNLPNLVFLLNSDLSLENLKKTLKFKVYINHQGKTYKDVEEFIRNPSESLENMKKKLLTEFPELNTLDPKIQTQKFRKVYFKAINKYINNKQIKNNLLLGYDEKAKKQSESGITAKYVAIYALADHMRLSRY